MSGKIIDLSNRLEQKQKENAARAAYDEHKAGCNECGKYDGRPLCEKGVELAEVVIEATHLPKLRHSRPSAQRRRSS